MSKVGKQIITNKTYLVIPTVTALRYTRISKSDYCMSVMLTRGYLETDSLEVAMYLRIYFHQADEFGFKIIGKIDKVNSNDDVVYRQRVEFSSFVNLLRLMNFFKIVLVIPSSVKINTRHLLYCSRSMKAVNRVSPTKDYTEWLTDATLLQLALICDIYNVELKMYKSLKELSYSGVLSQAPYICGSILKGGRNSTILVIPLSYYIEHKLLYLLGKKPKYYKVKIDSKSIPIFGFTKVTTSRFIRGRIIDEHID